MEDPEQRADAASTCADLEELLALRAAHQPLSPDQRDLLSSHLAVCVECRISLNIKQSDIYQVKKWKARSSADHESPRTGNA